MDYYKEDISKIIKELNTNESSGLERTEVVIRQKKYGPNKLQTENKLNKVKLFFDQFRSFIIYILLFAVAFSFFAGEYVDGIIILIILLVNAFIGFFQELSAHKSLEALKKLSTITAKVYRDSNLVNINSTELVPGDIIYLEAGDKVPADCRIIEEKALSVEEAALTGESVPVNKDDTKITKTVQIGDRTNMLFSSTAIANGTAKAVVVRTGMETEIGKITTLIKETQDELTPLQKKLDKFGKKLGYVIIFICVIVFAISAYQEYVTNGLSKEVFLHVILIAISLAVAAVPEGLPAVVTITLSIGVRRLLKKKALVRRLSSVETLGSCDVICTDKTGTLTKNEMTVRKAWTLNSEADIEGAGYNPVGHISNKVESLLYEIGKSCNNASLYKKRNIWTISGDPTEGALLVSARKAEITKNYKRIDELPFDSDRKMMSVLIKDGNKNIMHTKGAPDQILEKCTKIQKNRKIIPFTDKLKEEVRYKIKEYSSDALRVLGFAYKEVKTAKDFKEKDLIFVGLQAMIDPPRIDVIESIKKTKRAGIRVIMITGDHKDTARAIGEEIGITGEVLTGVELSKMTDSELGKALKHGTNIFARVIPEHKQRIITALQKQNHIVAMTGDGVNDAPALKKADIGIAVGSGTDVAKEASDFVLLDDSFSNIVNAIEEGRGIYDNIQKTIMHLLSGNLSEVLIIFIAVLFGFNLPLTAILLLWINLVTDGPPALALAVDPYGKDLMSQKPRNTREGILPKDKIALISYLGIVSTTIALIFFKLFGGAQGGAELAFAQTMAFTFVVISELVLLLIIRKQYNVKQFSNGWLWITIVTALIFQAIIMYSPLNKLFEIVALPLVNVLMLLGGGFVLYLSYLGYRLFMKN